MFQGVYTRRATLLILLLSTVPAIGWAHGRDCVTVFEPELPTATAFFQDTEVVIHTNGEELKVEPSHAKIYYPPTENERPHQVRWTVQCNGGEGTACLDPFDRILIRPKGGEKGSMRCVPSETDKGLVEEIGQPTYDIAAALGEEFRTTLFSPETSGQLSNRVSEEAPGLSILSGIPNLHEPKGASILWQYEVVLIRDGKPVFCLDPEIWVERDGGATGGRGGGGTGGH